jgi:hypothetical protein
VKLATELSRRRRARRSTSSTSRRPVSTSPTWRSSSRSSTGSSTRATRSSSSSTTSTSSRPPTGSSTSARRAGRAAGRSSRRGHPSRSRGPGLGDGRVPPGVLRGEPLIPLSDVTFAEEALRHPHLALVVGLRVTAPETDREHDIRFVLLDPDGAEVAGATGSLVARSQRDGRDAVLTFSIDLWNLTFPAPGDYSFRILVNGSERKRLPLLLLRPDESVTGAATTHPGDA